MLVMVKGTLLKKTMKWFAMTAKAEESIPYLITNGTISRNPRKFMQHANS